MNHLGLVESVDGLGQRVVVGVAHAAHRGLQSGLGQALDVANGDVLHAAVTVMHEPVRADRLAGVQRLLERVEHEVRAGRGRRSPAHDPAREHVDDEGDVDEALPGRDVGGRP